MMLDFNPFSFYLYKSWCRGCWDYFALRKTQIPHNLVKLLQKSYIFKNNHKNPYVFKISHINLFRIM